jgi:hypothetical protein
MQGADLILTDVSEVKFEGALNLETVTCEHAFYNENKPPQNLSKLPDNIKNKLLALDWESYTGEYSRPLT